MYIPTTELLPCPFCGGEPFLETNSRAYVNGSSERVSYVRCKKCNARTGKVPLSKYGHTQSSKEAVDEAISRWNTRREQP